MNLVKLIIKNFRGYHGEHIIPVDPALTALIGKNDAGKSTALEALDIFFDGSKPELEDLNIHADENDRVISVGCVFGDLPDEVTVDSSAKTRLSSEYLLNEDGELEVLKSYTCSPKSISSKPEISIRAVHPTAHNYGDLLKLKLEDLKRRGTDLGVTADDQRVNHLWRKVIWGNADDLELRRTILKIDELDTKVRAIYANLESIFPQYFLFKVDRQTTDADSEAKDPMQLAVKEAQKEYADRISELQQMIQARVDEVTKRALERLHEMDRSLADQLTPVLRSAPKWSFDYKIQDDRGVSLNKRGSGTRRLVLLNFFRAEAERRSKEREGNIIYAVEEPETSQHPNNQRMVIDALIELADDDKRQVLITTHSPQLTEPLLHDSIRFVEYDSTARNVITHAGEPGLMKAADSLGILSNQKLGSAAGVILVEGESDEVFLSHAADTLAASREIPSSFKEKNIIIICAGSCDNVPFWIQKHRLQDLGLPYAIFLDSDRMSATDPPTKNEIFCAKLVSAGIMAKVSRKREIENYIDPALSGVSTGDFDDAKELIAKHNKLRSSKVIETFWTDMSADQLLACSRFTDPTGVNRTELTELLSDLVSII